MDFGACFQKRLSAELPADYRFIVHHLSAPPTTCPALYSAPPNQKAEATEVESHFLTVSIRPSSQLIHIFALEVLVYTTRTLTTIFVSKADSTGYLYLLNLPKSAISPIKTVTSAFLELLVHRKSRNNARLVLSLFARAQNQYLFPGSIENSHKHVLNDRALIKWWCKIFDSILQKFHTSPPLELNPNSDPQYTARGFLVVPGCDTYETRAFFPKHPPALSSTNPPRWVAEDPLRYLGKPPTLPERCLIPRFPDDPKARFALDLDDELPENGPQPQDSPAKNPHPGRWRSVRSLDQFWELMEFRQECAAGRLVGFLWGVFEPLELFGRPFETHAELESEAGEAVPSTESNGEITHTTRENPHEQLQLSESISAQAKLESHSQTVPADVIADSKASQSNVSTSATDVLCTLTEQHSQGSVLTPDSASPHLSLLVSSSSYTEIVDRLLALDYADISLATKSTESFISEAVTAAVSETKLYKPSDWGVEIAGEREQNLEQRNTAEVTNGAPTTIEAVAKTTISNGNHEMTAQNVVALLGAGLVRKKEKAKKRDVEEAGLDNTGESGLTSTQLMGGKFNQLVVEEEKKKAESSCEEDTKGINLLSTNLVRKKSKVHPGD